MKKLFIVLLLPLTLCGKPIIDDIFTAGKNDIEKKIKTAVKDEIGWDKKTIEKRLKDGTYTETQILKIRRDKSQKAVKEDVKTKHDKIKPVTIDVIAIELKTIAVTGIKVADLQGLRFLRADWKTLKLALGRLSESEIKTLKMQFSQVEAVNLLFNGIHAAGIETVVLFIADLTAQSQSKTFNDVAIKRLLKAGDYKGMENLLSGMDMPVEIKDAVIRGIMPRIEPFFVDAVFEENAYLFDKNRGREVKDGDIVIVNVSDLTDRVEFAEFVGRNKGRRYIVQLGLGAMNNKDAPVTEWQEIARQFKEFYILAKSYDPGVCVGITVCAAPNWSDWEKIFNFKYDVIFLWNIYKQGFSVRAVKKQYGDNIVIAGMNAMGESKETSSPGELINKVRDAGFKGVIWYNRHP